MLGSQSTKGIHFLRAAGLPEVSPGVWRDADEGGRVVVTAIETYPAVALKSAIMIDLQGKTLSEAGGLQLEGKPLRDDISDALACALVAYLFVEQPTAIEPVPTVVPAGEGWIMLPLTPRV